MTIVVPNAGEEAMLDLILGEDYTLRLYRNDVTNGLTDDEVEVLTASDFDEATFAGYSAKTLTGGSWTTTGDDPSVGVYAAQTFTRSSTGTEQLIYGYYVTDTGGGLVWFENFPGPASMVSSGDAINVTPRFTLADETEDLSMAARGVIARFESEANDSGGPYSGDSVTDMVLSDVPVVAGRIYAVHLHTLIEFSATSSAAWNVFLRIDGNNHGPFDRLEASEVQRPMVDKTLYWEPDTTGTYDLDVYLDEATGSVTASLLGSGSNLRRTLTVIDLGLAP